jgi:chromosomal replication initiation ATPase DnaA
MLDDVCHCYGITGNDLKSPGKKRQFSEARAIAAAIVQESQPLSLTEYGKVTLHHNLTALVKRRNA